MTRRHMQRRAILLLMLALNLGVAWAAGTEKETGFIEIRIESHPPRGGYAHKTVKPDGLIVGGHLSGRSSAPLVHQSTARATPEDMRKLRELAAALQARTGSSRTQPAPPSKGYTSVTLVFGKSTEISVHASWRGKFEMAEAQAIWELLAKYPAGAW